MPGLMSCADQICRDWKGGALPSMRCGQSEDASYCKRCEGGWSDNLDICSKEKGRDGRRVGYALFICWLWDMARGRA